MYITSIILALLYISIRGLFKNYINYRGAAQENVIISIGAVMLLVSVIGHKIMPDIMAIWVGVAIVSVIIFQLPFLLQIYGKMSTKLVLGILTVLSLVPFVQYGSLAALLVLYIVLALKSHTAMTYISI